MALPTIQKIWQFDVNNIITGATVGNQNADLLWQLKNALVSFPVNPWTVVLSSNSVSAGGGDLWVTSGNLVWTQISSNAHSWIVLKQTGMGANFQILIDLLYTNGSGSNTFNIGVSISPSAGFTGGATTAIPTATDQVILFTNSAYGASNPAGSLQNPVLHAMQTTDGYSTRVYAMGSLTPAGFPSLAWCFERIKNPRSGVEWIFNMSVSNSTSFTEISYLTGGEYVKTVIGTYSPTVTYSTENPALPVDTNTFLRPNDITGEYQVYPANIIILSHEYRSYVGGLFDFYICPVSIHLNYFPDTSGNARKWIAFRNVMIPWDGSSTALISGV